MGHQPAAVNLEDAEVAVVVLVPDENIVPERMPRITDAGNLSLKKLTKSDRAGFYSILVCGHLLATIRETFAVAPGVDAARVVVLRDLGRDAYGKARADCLMAARFTRVDLEGVQWAAADSARIVNDVSSDLRINQRGQTKALAPLDLSDEPELAALVELVNLRELAD